MKKYFLLYLLALLPLVASAYDAEIDGFYYNLNSNGDVYTAEVTKGSNKYSGDIVIPESVIYGGVVYRVTSIGGAAFDRCSSLTSVTIPNSVTSIGQEAFSDCTGLISVSISNSVTSIDFEAFYNCSSLTSITIPNGVTTIWDDAFCSCTGLTSVIIGNSVTYIGNGVFAACSSLTSVTIPNSVTSIGNNIFYNCSNLTDVKVSVSDFSSFCNNSVVGLIKDKIAKPVTLVDNEGKEIKELVIPDDVTSIGNYAFFNCSGLTSVTVKCSPTSIGMNPFGACTNLKEVTFDCETVTSLFSYSSSIEKVTMTESVTSIENVAFAGCSSLASITIPNSVNHIGYGAFTDTAWYDNQPDGIVYAGKVIIGYKGTMPEGLDIKDGTVSIASHAFAFQRGLTSITIPNSMISIDGYAFYGCLGIVDVFCYAEKVPRLDREAFFWEDVDDFYTFHSRITLHVPASSIEAYKAADIWSEFKEIVAIEEETDVDEIKISSAGQTTWCSAYDLDFTDVEGLKAYIASGYHRTKGTIWLTRVKEVPAGEGILLIGDEGEYKVPRVATTAYYANLMVGTVEAITINETDGEYTNYYLSNGASGIGFYKVNGSVDIKANRAYLPLLKNTVSGSRGFIGVDFDDDSDGTTNVQSSMFNLQSDEVYYNLQGQRVEKPEKGIYIKNGKKVIVK